MCCGALTRSSRLLRRCRPLALPRRRPAAPPVLAPPPSAAAPPSHAPPQPARVQSAVCILCLWVSRTPHCSPAADCGIRCASHMRVRATLHSPWLGKPAAARPSRCSTCRAPSQPPALACSTCLVPGSRSSSLCSSPDSRRARLAGGGWQGAAGLGRQADALPRRWAIEGWAAVHAQMARLCLWHHAFPAHLRLE